jgi:hypothetical protein
MSTPPLINACLLMRLAGAPQMPMIVVAIACPVARATGRRTLARER